ncbi:MAG TPA: 30S ribosomal protein S16 [Bdellovibrionota bacterium]|nr:30S ribosomal protein S16 [Bdellovibrionota bacterium]
MSVTIRLARHGTNNKPFFRVVVADRRFSRNGRYLDIVGQYDPRAHGETISLNKEKIDEWLKKGAQPTDRVRDIIKRSLKS